jgi:putative toxin-antitoxin system antitoxin component (TIGR02293 family)
MSAFRRPAAPKPARGVSFGKSRAPQVSVGSEPGGTPAKIPLAFRGDTAEIIRTMRSGILATVVPDMAARFGLNQDGFVRMLGLPVSTPKSRLTENDDLSSSERDRLYRAEKVWQRALEVLGDEDAVRHWVVRANRSLGGEAPLSLLDTEPGYELVLDALGRIEYGIVA